jgi:hypothetical protein
MVHCGEMIRNTLMTFQCGGPQESFPSLATVDKALAAPIQGWRKLYASEVTVLTPATTFTDWCHCIRNLGIVKLEDFSISS